MDPRKLFRIKWHFVVVAWVVVFIIAYFQKSTVYECGLLYDCEWWFYYKVYWAQNLAKPILSAYTIFYVLIYLLERRKK